MPGVEEELGRLSLVCLRWATPPLAAALGGRVLAMLAAALKDPSERGMRRALPVLQLAMQREARCRNTPLSRRPLTDDW